MIKRAGHLNRHAGEISFPGGMFETEDVDLLTTALRETREELHIEVPIDSVVGCLSTVVTATGIMVTPFVAIVPTPPRYEANGEVELVLEIAIADLFATGQQDTARTSVGDSFIFQSGEHRIWGASAKILYELARSEVF